MGASESREARREATVSKYVVQSDGSSSETAKGETAVSDNLEKHESMVSDAAEHVLTSFLTHCDSKDIADGDRIDMAHHVLEKLAKELQSRSPQPAEKSGSVETNVDGGAKVKSSDDVSQGPTEEQLQVDTSKGPLPDKAVNMMGNDLVRRKSMAAVDKEKAMVNRKAVHLLGDAQVAGSKPYKVLGSPRSEKFIKAERAHRTDTRKDLEATAGKASSSIAREPSIDLSKGALSPKALNSMGDETLVLMSQRAIDKSTAMVNKKAIAILGNEPELGEAIDTVEEDAE
eukprot:g3997.t1